MKLSLDKPSEAPSSLTTRLLFSNSGQWNLCDTLKAEVEKDMYQKAEN